MRSPGAGAGYYDSPASKKDSRPRLEQRARVRCGRRVNVQLGQRFTCWDVSDNVNKQCWGIGIGNYKCLDPTNGKIEWPNWNERDGTPDKSDLTSVVTDGLLATSPSIALGNQAEESEVSVASASNHRLQQMESPDKMKKCGKHFKYGMGEQFACWDQHDNVVKNCWGIGDRNYKCLDPTNGKIEWPNWNEDDYTPDNSRLTSIETDNILATSPSPLLFAEVAEVPIVTAAPYSANNNELPPISTKVVPAKTVAE